MEGAHLPSVLVVSCIELALDPLP